MKWKWEDGDRLFTFEQDRIKLFCLPVNYIYVELAVPCLFLYVYVCVRQAERPQIKTESNLAWLNPVWPDLHPVCPHCSALTILLLLNHSRKSCTMSRVNTHTGIYSALEFSLPPFHSLLHTHTDVDKPVIIQHKQFVTVSLF